MGSYAAEMLAHRRAINCAPSLTGAWLDERCAGLGDKLEAEFYSAVQSFEIARWARSKEKQSQSVPFPLRGVEFVRRWSRT